jgi:geranylgeranylglycerol-phosphate geranylgeranyltransferase
MKAFIELVRPLNVMFGMVGVVVGALVASGMSIVDHAYPVVFGCTVVATFMAGGNALNDYTDREGDRRNHPGRPIPSGRLGPRTVLVFSAIMFIICIAFAFFLDRTATVIALIAACLMISYDLGLKHKGFVGNAAISLLVGMLFLFGGAVVGNPLPTVSLLLLAFLATLSREVVKDIQDIEGDLDRRTLPKRIGISRSRTVAGALVVLAVVLSPAPAVFDLLGPGYLYVVVAADAIFIYSITRFKDPARASTLLKVAMGVGLAAFIAGGFT